MSRSISPDQLQRERQSWLVVDVRKDPARATSGFVIAGSIHRRPFAADSWWREMAVRPVVVYCVHGHEVSQAVCGFLCDQGIDARFLEGGFEAWRVAGHATEPVGETHR